MIEFISHIINIIILMICGFIYGYLRGRDDGIKEIRGVIKKEFNTLVEELKRKNNL